MVLLSTLQKQSHISILTSSDHSTVYCARPRRSIINRISILPIVDIMVFIPWKSPQFEGKLTLPRALGRHPIAYSPGQSILTGMDSGPNSRQEAGKDTQWGV